MSRTCSPLCPNRRFAGFPLNRLSAPDVINQTPGAIIPSHTILNGRIQWDAANGKWSVAALGTNLTNKEYYLSLFDLRAFGEGMESGQPAPPREFALNVKYNF